MSDRLVSPATWRKSLRRFLLLISWGRVQTIQKTSLVCFFFFFNHIYEESVPDRTMRVQSLFCTCFEFNTANQSGKSTYNFLMIWRTALRREQISLKIDITQVQYHRIKICPPNLQIHRDGSQLTGLMWLIKASVKSAPWEWKVAFLSAGSSRDSQHILLRSVGNFSCRLMSHITLIIEMSESHATLQH